MATTTEIVDEQIAAYVAGDTERFAATYAENASCTEIPSGRVIAANREDIRRIWGEMFARSPRDCQIMQRIVQDDFVIDHERITLANNGEIIDAVAIYRVGPDLIEQVWFPARPPKSGD